MIDAVFQHSPISNIRLGMTKQSLRAAASISPDTAPPEVGGRPLSAIELSQIVVAVGAGLLLHWSKSFFAPLLFGILVSYALRLPVDALERKRLPRALAAALMLCTATALTASVAYSLRGDALELVEQLPDAASRIRIHVQGSPSAGAGPLAKIGRAATELEKAATEAAGGTAPARSPPSQGNGLGFVKQFLLVQTTTAMITLLQVASGLLIAFFLLTAGSAFRRKLTRLAGPSLARRRATVDMLNEIDAHIQRYLLVMIATNVLIGLVTWGFLAAIGVERALLLGTVAGLFHIIPYVGSALAATAAAVVGMLQFSDLRQVGLAVGGVVGIAALIGFGVNTWLQAYALRMNSTVVIVGVLFFGWFWGAWGLFLAVPLLAVLKTVADRIPQWQLVAEFLGE
jgi:predicted PurR-regulated permease PerM